MKKPIAIMTAMALLLSGCSASGSGTVTPAAQNPAPEAAGESAAAQSRPNGQQPEGKRLRGQIQDILGNEVTLALAEAPKRPEGDTAAVKPKTTGDPMGGPPMGGQGAAVKLTGETQVLQIPVGVPIVSRGKDGETTLQLGDLSVGSIITVQYDTDGTTIVKVNVAAGGAQ